MNLFCNRIQKARRKINSKGYVKKRIWKIANELEYWNTFYDFECSSFFRGHVKADINRKKYEKATRRLYGKLEWYENKARCTI